MYKWNYKKCFSDLLTAAAVVVLAWLVLSWLDVAIHNTRLDYEYSNANLLYLFIKRYLK
jgi:hypothetical protein